MRTFYDQIGRRIEVKDRIEKIVCLVPSLTELLFDLGLDKEIVGVTQFCIHPKTQTSTKTKVRGTKNPDFQKIKKLKPDVILCNKEENTKEIVNTLEQDFPTYVTNINNMEEALSSLSEIGKLFSKEKESNLLISQIQDEQNKYPIKVSENAVYLIWNKPIMTAGSNNYISETLQIAGFNNLIKEERYPTITEDDLVAINPKHLLLSSEPFPFKEKHRIHYQNLLPECNVRIVDGEMFSWYGSRMKKSFKYFHSLWQ